MQEIYFNHCVPLYTAGGKDEVIPGGVHSFPFSFTLPQRLPSSFEGGTGRVRMFKCSFIPTLFKYLVPARFATG